MLFCTCKIDAYCQNNKIILVANSEIGKLKATYSPLPLFLYMYIFN